MQTVLSSFETHPLCRQSAPQDDVLILMASQKPVILRRPRSGRLEGRATAIQQWTACSGLPAPQPARPVFQNRNCRRRLRERREGRRERPPLFFERGDGGA